MSETREIPLTKGMVALVDAEDFESLSLTKWWANGTKKVYAYRSVRKSEGRRRMVAMHRVVAGAKDGEHVDHINGNGLDNRRANLRICDPAQNCANKLAYKDQACFRGIRPDKGGWRAQATIRGVIRQLGTFDSREEAAAAYDVAILEAFGEFAVPNLDNPTQPLTRRQKLGEQFPCPMCGSPRVVKRMGRTPKWCSYPCRWKARQMRKKGVPIPTIWGAGGEGDNG